MHLFAIRTLCVTTVLFVATDIHACSCPMLLSSVAASQLASRIVESGAIVIRAKVLHVNRDPARPGSDTTADIQIKESYFGEPKIGTVTTAPNEALCGITLQEGVERDFLLTRDGRAGLCDDILLRTVPNLIDEIRLLGKK